MPAAILWAGGGRFDLGEPDSLWPFLDFFSVLLLGDFWRAGVVRNVRCWSTTLLVDIGTISWFKRNEPHRDMLWVSWKSPIRDNRLCAGWYRRYTWRAAGTFAVVLFHILQISTSAIYLPHHLLSYILFEELFTMESTVDCEIQVWFLKILWFVDNRVLWWRVSVRRPCRKIYPAKIRIQFHTSNFRALK